MRYSPAGIVKRSLSITVYDIGITVSFIHQISDYIEMSTPGVQNIISLHPQYNYATMHADISVLSLC